jgi:hypothetical protein
VPDNEIHTSNPVHDNSTNLSVDELSDTEHVPAFIMSSDDEEVERIITYSISHFFSMVLLGILQAQHDAKAGWQGRLIGAQWTVLISYFMYVCWKNKIIQLQKLIRSSNIPTDLQRKLHIIISNCAIKLYFSNE